MRRQIIKKLQFATLPIMAIMDKHIDKSLINGKFNCFIVLYGQKTTYTSSRAQFIGRGDPVFSGWPRTFSARQDEYYNIKAL